MVEFGGPEIGQPSEGGSGVSEHLSEEAKERFRAAQAAMQQIRAEEKKARKRDDRVAHVIVQFLGGDDSSPLFQLIAQLAARNCPSIFILSVISLISEPAAAEVDQYLADQQQEQSDVTSVTLPTDTSLSEDVQHDLLRWIMHMRSVMATDARTILLRLLIDERNIDGTVLQITSFVLGNYFEAQKINLSYDDSRTLAGGILQTVFEPFLDAIDRKTLRERNEFEESEE